MKSSNAAACSRVLNVLYPKGSDDGTGTTIGGPLGYGLAINQINNGISNNQNNQND